MRVRERRRRFLSFSLSPSLPRACVRAEGREGDFLSRSLFPLTAFLSLPRTLSLSLSSRRKLFPSREILLSSPPSHSILLLFCFSPSLSSCLLATEITSVAREPQGELLFLLRTSLSPVTSLSLSRDTFSLSPSLPSLSSRRKLLPLGELLFLNFSFFSMFLSLPLALSLSLSRQKFRCEERWEEKPPSLSSLSLAVFFSLRRHLPSPLSSRLLTMEIASFARRGERRKVFLSPLSLFSLSFPLETKIFLSRGVLSILPFLSLCRFLQV